MSARPTDDARVREMYRQACIAQRRMEVLGLSDADLTASYDPTDVKGMTIEAIFGNVYAVAEEASNLDIDTVLEFPGYPWGEIRGMRNRMAHEYFQLDRRVLAEVIDKDLPSIIAFCHEYSDERGIDLYADSMPSRDVRRLALFPEQGERSDVRSQSRESR